MHICIRKKDFMGKEFPEDIQKMFEKFSESTDNSGFDNSDTSSFNSSSFEDTFGNIDMNTIIQLKSVMEKMNQKKNSNSSQLLYSLKPYLRDSRKEKLDNYIKLLNMGQLIEGLGIIGGENRK